MSNVLLVWELGGGLGHLSRLRPIALGLAARGHRVVGAFRDLQKVPLVFGDHPIEYVQAPARRSGPRQFAAPRTYAELLASIGFGDATELRGFMGAWRTLFSLIRPDLVICDHSPTALLAARAYAFKQAVLGTGFFCPPVGEHLPRLRPGMSEQELLDGESAVLNNVNRALGHIGQSRLLRLSDLYREVDETILTTFPELDHFGPRPAAKYWGVWPVSVTKKSDFNWPQGDGRRVYAYLKPFDALDALLQRLTELRLPTVVVGDGIQPEMKDRFESQSIRFSPEPIAAAQAADWCDIGVLNATHGMLSAMLLAGKPTLNIPVQFEQRLLSLKIVELRAGVAASPQQPDEVVRAFDYMLANRERLAVAAQGFAERYQDFDADSQINRLLDRFEELLSAQA
jgi:hypothetical protein